MNLATFCPRQTNPSHITPLELDDSVRRPGTDINQATTWKTMSAGGVSQAKITSNPIICLEGVTHVHSAKAEWSRCFIFVTVRSYFSDLWQTVTTGCFEITSADDLIGLITATLCHNSPNLLYLLKSRGNRNSVTVTCPLKLHLRHNFSG